MGAPETAAAETTSAAAPAIFGDAEYVATLNVLVSTARAVAELPLHMAMDVLVLAEQHTPADVDAETSSALRDQRQLLAAFLRVQRAVEDIKARAS